MRLRVRPDVHYYPDVMVACGPEPNDPYVGDAPVVLVEVLSSTTARTDRGEKLFFHRQIPSLRSYLIVDPERVQVERHWRGQGSEWEAEIHSGGSIPVPMPECAIPLRAIYAGTDLTG